MKNLLKIVGCSLTVLSLVACQNLGKEITEAEANTIMVNMAKTSGEAKKYTATTKAKMDMTIESALVKESSTTNLANVVAYDYDAVYGYISQKGTVKTKATSPLTNKAEEETEEINTKAWYYYKDGCFIEAEDDGENKEYTSIQMTKEAAILELDLIIMGEEAGGDFTSALASYINGVLSEEALAYLDCNVETKYYSKNDNNVTMQTSIKSKDKKDGTNYQLSYTYQDNILVSGKSKGTISLNLGDLVQTGGSSEELGDLGGLVGSLLGDAKMTIKSDSAVSGSKSCKLNYPDLKNFTRY